MFKNILVAYDGSTLSQLALKKALDLAKIDGNAEIKVVHVLQLPTAERALQYPRLRENAYKVGHQILQEAENKLGEGLKGFRTYLLEGTPARTILQFAASNGCDVIVMGRRGLNGFQEFFLGSVSHQIIQQSSIPVFIVK